MKNEIEKNLKEESKWYNNAVFNRDEDDDYNELVDEEDLMTTFLESPMGKLIQEVKRLSNVSAFIRISESTYDIPFVDFETGVRVICLDCDEMSQLKVNLSNIQKQVPFNFKLKKKEDRRTVILYSDALTSKNQVKATLKSLLKIVNRDNFDGKRIINLSGNYSLFYTDNFQAIKEFEGLNSVYPYGKPSNKQIAIIAMRPNNNSKISAKDIINCFNGDRKLDLESFNLYMVASARYIAIPQHDKENVEYIITQYTELAPTIVKDGFDHIVAAIIKEHKANNTVKDFRNPGFDFSNYKYSFVYEFDKSLLPSPSLEIWFDNDGFIKTNLDYGVDYAYIRKPDFRGSVVDGWRVDERMFLPIPLGKRFKEEIAASGFNVTIDSQRLKFISRMGFEKIYQPKIIKYMLNPIIVMKAVFEQSNIMMSKIDLSKYFAGGSLYEGGYDNLLIQRMLMNNIAGEDKAMLNNMYSAMMFSKMFNQN